MKFYSVIIKKKPIQLATLSHGTIYLYRILQHDISALSFFISVLVVLTTLENKTT